MSAAVVDVGHARKKSYAAAKREQISQGHQLIDSNPRLSLGAKHFGHLVVNKLVALKYEYLSASCSTLAVWLEEEKAIGGCRYRIGTRGPAKCGPKRPTRSSETMRRYVHELRREGLLKMSGGGTAIGRRYAGKKPRGLRWWLRPSGLLHDVLRGAYKPWRDEFAKAAAPVRPLFPPSEVSSDPLPAPHSTLLGSTVCTAVAVQEKKEETASPLPSSDGSKSTDALAPPRTSRALRRPESGSDIPSDDEHARRLERLSQRGVDPPAKDRDPRD